jgi:hypothetical protein
MYREAGECEDTIKRYQIFLNSNKDDHVGNSGEIYAFIIDQQT